MPPRPFVPSWLFESLQAIPHLLADQNQLGWPALSFLLVVALLVNRRFIGRSSPPHGTLGAFLAIGTILAARRLPSWQVVRQAYF